MLSFLVNWRICSHKIAQNGLVNKEIEEGKELCPANSAVPNATVYREQERKAEECMRRRGSQEGEGCDQLQSAAFVWMTSWYSASVNAVHGGMNIRVARSSHFPEDGRIQIEMWGCLVFRWLSNPLYELNVSGRPYCSLSPLRLWFLTRMLSPRLAVDNAH